MLPDFPSIKAERFERLLKAAYEHSRQQRGLLTRLREPIMQPEGMAVQLSDVEGNAAMTDYETIGGKLEIHVDELPLLHDEQWFNKLTTMTGAMADAQETIFLRRVNEATTAGGNVVSTKGEPISEEHILAMFDKVQLDFIEGGQVSPDVAFVMHPDLAQHLMQLEESEEFKRRHAQIIDRQYIEWRFREANRKLVD